MESERKTNIIKIVIILSALVIAALLLAFPGRQYYQQAQDTNKQIKVTEQEKNDLEQRLTDLKQLEINYGQAKEKSKNTVAYALPTDKQWPDLLTELQTITSGSGLMFVEVKSGGQANKATGTKTSTESSSASSQQQGAIYHKLPITVSIAGDFAGLKGYLKGLEKNMRIIDINSITIQKEVNPITQKPDILIALDMTCYFQNK